MALALAPGDYLGSEESLTQKLGITGPTLRQAIRLLEHEGVIGVKRGVGGGYFANRPDAKTTSRVAAAYLRSNMQSIDEITVAMEHIIPLLIELAIAGNRLDEFEPFADPARAAKTYAEFITQHSQFINLLWDVSNNAPLKLLYAICYNVGDGLELDPLDEMTPEIVELQQVRLKCAQALCQKDRDAATSLALTMVRTVHRGIKDNVQKFGSPMARPGTRPTPDSRPTRS